jgi:hypothetical protein
VTNEQQRMRELIIAASIAQQATAHVANGNGGVLPEHMRTFIEEAEGVAEVYAEVTEQDAVVKQAEAREAARKAAPLPGSTMNLSDMLMATTVMHVGLINEFVEKYLRYIVARLDCGPNDLLLRTSERWPSEHGSLHILDVRKGEDDANILVAFHMARSHMGGFVVHATQGPSFPKP